MNPYLYVSCLAFLLTVSQGGHRHVLNQLLELLIASHKICFTVNLYKQHTTSPHISIFQVLNRNNNSDGVDTYLHHHSFFVSYKQTYEALFGFSAFQLVCFGPALFLGLFM